MSAGRTIRKMATRPDHDSRAISKICLSKKYEKKVRYLICCWKMSDSSLFRVYWLNA